ncbi:group II intron reverse transcriptase/maturase [Breznakia blatticola]|uniref:group II intron reverse transcriptase/maturase n=1 Tax=Breznakia blatticola TaxID=1754012 RepID=UPI001416FA4A|nr:group II intron reverse transcriptase/maturase [Breznakia blatticola]
MENELKSISLQSKKFDKVQSLLPLVNKGNLLLEHRRQNANKAVGVDGVTKEEYGQDLENNIDKLLSAMKAMRYRPQPTRRVDISKEDGSTRPLGIPCYEDKLVQGIMAKALSATYEERFLECSYGFRPNRSAHEAISVINHTIMFRKVNYILDCDIKGFFNHVNHKWLVKFLENDIQDPKFIRYIVRFLKSGVMEDMKFSETDEGTPQGGLISPVLANVYLHYVLDLWFEKYMKKRLKGYAKLVRYCDDFIIMFQYENEAKMVYEELIPRLAKFNLEINTDKTKAIPFGRYKGTKESFDFLGFAHINGKTRNGKYTVHHTIGKKKLKAKKRSAKAWLKLVMHKPIAEIMETINRKLRGLYNYYGISGNYKGISKFYKYYKYEYYRILRRRGQKNPIKYKDYLRIWDYFIKEKPSLKVNIWY